MEESGIFSSAILDSSEDKSLPSDSDGSSISLVGPQFCNDVLFELAKYFDIQTIKSARLVSATWNKALETQSRKKIMLQAGFNYELSIRKFVKVFNPNTTDGRLIASSIWIKKSKFLKHQLMTNWLETYGKQLTTVQLGKPLEDAETWYYKDKHFSVKSIESLLTRYCPNLKIFKIFVPFIPDDASVKALDDLKDVDVALDHLELGHQENVEPEFYQTSRFLLNVLKYIKSVKSVKIVSVTTKNLHRVNRNPEVSSPGDDYAKRVFENIQELNLFCGNVDPRRLFHRRDPETQFKNLQKLEIGCFCSCGGGLPIVYLPDLLSSIKNQLKELIFYQCPIELGYLDDQFSCPNISNCFLLPMPRLEIFRVLLIMNWNEASLNFIEKLPVLKQLQITLDKFCEDKKCSLPEVEQIFNAYKSQRRIAHHEHELEELTFRCFTKSSKSFSNIRFCFPNLKKLEVDFCGTPVFYVFRTFKKLKDLTLHLFQPFESLDADDFEELAGSSIEKLCLERDDLKSKRWIKLSSIVDGCLSSRSIKELSLKGMKISRGEYELAMEKLKMTKLHLSLNNCEIDFEEW